MEAAENNTTSAKMWTPEEDAILRQFWGDISTRAIGAKLGRKKNSIISRAHRIGLPGYSPVFRRLAILENAKTATKVLKNRNSMFFRTPIQTTKVVKMKPGDIKPLNGVGVTFAELESSNCRWMMDNDTHFCGHTVKKGKSFCPDHHSIAYRPFPEGDKRNGHR